MIDWSAVWQEFDAWFEGFFEELKPAPEWNEQQEKIKQLVQEHTQKEEKP